MDRIYFAASVYIFSPPLLAVAVLMCVCVCVLDREGMTNCKGPGVGDDFPPCYTFAIAVVLLKPRN